MQNERPVTNLMLKILYRYLTFMYSLVQPLLGPERLSKSLHPINILVIPPEFEPVTLVGLQADA